MLFSSYLRLKYAKYFLYLFVDFLLTYFVTRYLSETEFAWTFFGQIYLVIVGVQLIFILRDGLVNLIFMWINQKALIQGLVSELNSLGYPKSTAGIDCPKTYFDRITNDENFDMALRQNAAKYANLMNCIHSSASGWINHQVYTRLLEKSINQYTLST